MDPVQLAKRVISRELELVSAQNARQEIFHKQAQQLVRNARLDNIVVQELLNV